MHQRPRGCHPRARTTELHPGRLGGWTCTSDHVGVSYELLLLSYTERVLRAYRRDESNVFRATVWRAWHHARDQTSRALSHRLSPKDRRLQRTHEQMVLPSQQWPRAIERNRTSPGDMKIAGHLKRRHCATKRNRTSPDARQGAVPVEPVAMSGTTERTRTSAAGGRSSAFHLGAVANV